MKGVNNFKFTQKKNPDKTQSITSVVILILLLNDFSVLLVWTILECHLISRLKEYVIHSRPMYNIGLEVWKTWMANKVNTPETSSSLNILDLSSKDLNICLALFVREINQNKTQCRPDKIYYCCLGIQKFLLENRRREDIFNDLQYQDFISSFDKAISNFKLPRHLVPNVNESHLWDLRQLGDHSPYVLIHTLMYLFTKHLDLKTVEHHMTLSIKQLTGEFHGANNSYIPEYIRVRLYPFIGSTGDKMIILQKNNENPRICPVRLCYLYLTKCPPNIKLYHQLFYLQPENNYVADSPIWFTPRPLPLEDMERNFNRIRVVKEINDLFLTN